MRGWFLVACGSICLAACSDNEETAENTSSIDQNVSIESVTPNDTTAIDAATSQDANMAADVNFTINTLDENLSGGSNTSAKVPTNAVSNSD
jgi:hypothetical protein